MLTKECIDCRRTRWLCAAPQMLRCGKYPVRDLRKNGKTLGMVGIEGLPELAGEFGAAERLLQHDMIRT